MDQDPDKIRALIEKAIGFPDSTTHGEMNYWCPFCEKRGFVRVSHLHVNYQKNLAICHQCGGWKDLLNVVRALYGKVPRSLMEVSAGVELTEYLRETMDRAMTQGKTEEAPTVKVELPEEFIPLSAKPKDTIGQMVLKYLRGRDVDDQMIEEIGAGYCNTGRFKGYAIFPIYIGGRLITYTSRRVVGTDAKAQHAPSSESHVALFNYDVAATMGAKRVFIGEGPFDAWAFHRRADPLDAGVGLLGKVLHPDQARLLDRLPCDELCMCLDDTEHARTIRWAKRLARMTSKRVSYILLPEGVGDPHENRLKLKRYVRDRVEYDPIKSELMRRIG